MKINLEDTEWARRIENRLGSMQSILKTLCILMGIEITYYSFDPKLFSLSFPDGGFSEISIKNKLQAILDYLGAEFYRPEEKPTPPPPVIIVKKKGK